MAYKKIINKGPNPRYLNDKLYKVGEFVILGQKDFELLQNDNNKKALLEKFFDIEDAGEHEVPKELDDSFHDEDSQEDLYELYSPYLEKKAIELREIIRSTENKPLLSVLASSKKKTVRNEAERRLSRLMTQ